MENIIKKGQIVPSTQSADILNANNVDLDKGIVEKIGKTIGFIKK